MKKPATKVKRSGAPRVPVAVDLFAGAGGLAEGLASAGIHVAVASELHPQAALTHAFNHPEADVIFGDVRLITAQRVRKLLKARLGDDTVDIVVGGPPCQGFSTAGKKAASDPRNSLFHEFVRFVDELRPRMFLLENVPGFKKMHEGEACARATALFAALGYKMMDTIVDAADYGVPQRRKRFVMVGWLPGKVDAFSWPTATHEQQSAEALPLFRSALSSRATAADALEDIAFLEPGWEAHRHKRKPACEFQAARQNGGKYLFNHLATRHRPKAVAIFKWIKEGKTIASVPEGIRSAKRTMARLARNEISNAVLALPDDLIHYAHDRIPTVREMARLQTFDDDYVFFGKRTSGFVERRVDVPQYTQVGNAVPPLLARALGRALVQALGGEVCDRRDIKTRRARHAWVRGSSGFAGYTLDPEAEGKITLYSADGVPFSLPVWCADERVVDAKPLVEWRDAVRTLRGQWAPGVQAKAQPAHVGDGTSGNFERNVLRTNA